VITWAYLTIKYKDGRGPVNLWVNVEYKIENGKIAQSRTFYDEADVLRQLNYTIEPPIENN
jgi:limonene-1,2-epoxide hydrolase